MTHPRITLGATLALLAAVVCVHLQTAQLSGQGVQQRAGIQSVTEPGEGLSVRDRSSAGLATFASTDGRGVLVSTPPGASAERRARTFVSSYGAAFGAQTDADLRLIQATPADGLGIEHVRFQQTHLGVPVVGGDFIVHLRGDRVYAVNGTLIDGLPATVAATVPAADARQIAIDLVSKLGHDLQAGVSLSEPRLEILDPSRFDPSFLGPRVAWFVEARGDALREFIWVDAQTASVLHHHSQLMDARSRFVYTANNSSALPGTLVRSEDGASIGDADADNAYDFAGLTYDYYSSEHGRDSYDNAGAALRSTVHYCPAGSCPNYSNAFWNGTQMVYGNGFSSADDVVAHELTHAVTERTANLVYSRQSGALNESFSDIFGEVVDLTDGRGNDAAAVRWLTGEDLSIGAIRNMSNPAQFDHPAKVTDANYYCSSFDNGGVHYNSGIPNHAFALMVDGGSYNGRTITGIGLAKAGKIQYRALATYLTPLSGFNDAFNAINQSCSDLVGTIGITTNDCAQVRLAVEAVEMNLPAPCGAPVPPPPLCPTGSAPEVVLLADAFENASLPNWTRSSTSAATWSFAAGYGRLASGAVLGEDPFYISDHRLATTASVAIPTGTRLYFDSAFTFESSFDGGVIEYSVDDGTTWVDAGSMIEAGQAYNGTIATGWSNPLAGRRAFVDTSNGFTATRLTLAGLAGQTAKFRFRVATDSSVSSVGWLIDNLSIHRCPAVRMNVAFAANGGVASASSTFSPSYGPSGAINGDRSGLNWGSNGGWNDGTPNGYPDWWAVTFASPQTIDEINVFSVQDAYQSPSTPFLGQTFTQYGLTDFEVQAWNGSTWVAVPGGTITANNQVWRQLRFTPVTTGAVRVLVNAAVDIWSRLAEVEVYSVGPPSAPEPFNKMSPLPNSAEQLSSAVSLTWQGSSGASSYEYCVDLTNDATCDSGWISTNAREASLSGLADGATYYWQVRAVNSTGVRMADSGSWWPFTTSDGRRMNVAAAARGARAIASSTHSAGYAASGVINGDRAGFNWGNGGGWNDAIPGAWPDWIVVEFAGLRTIDRVDVFSVQDQFQTPATPVQSQTFTRYGVTDFEVQAWNGSAFVTVQNGTIANNNQVWRSVTFPPITTGGIRVLVNGALDTWSRITEVEAYTVGTAAPPGTFGKETPLPGLAPQPLSAATLSWQVSPGATGYEYCVFTDDVSPCDESAGQWTPTAGLSAVLTGLTANTEYGWQVRAVNASGKTPANGGDRWGFRTGDAVRVNVAAAARFAVPVVSSTFLPQFAADGAINGDRTGLNWGNGGGWNDGTPGTWPDWFAVAFAGVETIDQIDVFSLQDNFTSPVAPTADQTFTLYGLTSFEVQTWNGAAWITVPGGVVTGNNRVWRRLSFAPITTRAIRILVNGALDTWSRIAEVEAYTAGAAGAPASDHLESLSTPEVASEFDR